MRIYFTDTTVIFYRTVSDFLDGIESSRQQENDKVRAYDFGTDGDGGYLRIGHFTEDD